MQHLVTQTSCRAKRRQAGFTLIEIIMVMVLLGLMGLIGVDFITEMFRGFNQTNSRLAIYEEGKDALVRMERELHNMLPNGICVTNDQGATCVSDGSSGNEIQFGMISENGMRSNNCSGAYSEQPFTFPTSTPAVLTDVNSGATPQVNSIISVYNTDWNSFRAGTKLFRITSSTANEMTFGGQTITNPSPQGRYYILDRAISYRWDNTNNTLYRSVTTVSDSGMGSFSSVTEYPLAQDVQNMQFFYMAPSLSRNGIISVLFTMDKGDNSINMHKEIHVKNVP